MNAYATAANHTRGDYPDQPVDPRLVDALYAEAARLEAAWRHSGARRLSDDLPSRMVAATLRLLDRAGVPLTPRPEERDAVRRRAVGLLRYCWRRNARRDAARAAARCPLVPLDDAGAFDAATTTRLYRDDPRGGQTGREAVDYLVTVEGLAPAVAEALVLSLCGYAWDDVQTLLADRGHRTSHDQLRQWGARHRERCRRALAAQWEDAA